MSILKIRLQLIPATEVPNAKRMPLSRSGIPWISWVESAKFRDESPRDSPMKVPRIPREVSRFGISSETGFLPDGLVKLFAGVLLQADDRTAKGGRCPPERNQAFKQADQRDNRNGTVYDIIGKPRKDRRNF